MHNKQLVRLRATKTHRMGIGKALKLYHNILSPGYDLISLTGLFSFIEHPVG